MNEMNPLLLLLLGMLAVAHLIVWGLAIYVTVVVARNRDVKVWPWALLAVGAGLVSPGAILLSTGYLAKVRRRSVGLWVAMQVIVGYGALLAMVYLLWLYGSHSLALSLPILFGGLILSAAPLILLSLLTPAEPDAPDKAQAMIQARNLGKSYLLGSRRLEVLRDVSLSIREGEFVAVLGASGSGKSTLLHLLGLLDAPNSGAVLLGGQDAADLSPDQRDRLRCRHIGFVFQFYHLLPELNILENVMLPAMTDRGIFAWPGSRGKARQRALKLLEKFGLGDRLSHRPKELSGGEQQRVAIARALMNSPRILLADEPTGNLDSNTGSAIIRALKQLNVETRQTIVMVTHDLALAEIAGRVIHLRDGRLQ